jgi:hypothetical protein
MVQAVEKGHKENVECEEPLEGRDIYDSGQDLAGYR